MKSGLVFILALMITSFGAIAQETNWKSFPQKTADTLHTDHILSDTLPAPKNAVGSLEINVSPEIVAANEAYTEASKNTPQIKGYTILLFSGSGANSKLKARNLEINFNEKFPKTITHLAWKSPNYEVRAGDFRTKLEAEKTLKEIRAEFPTAFVKSDLIELPALYEESPTLEEEGAEEIR